MYSSDNSTYAIAHGFSNNRLHSAKMRKLLDKAGYHEVGELSTADIIIAHSAGCYTVPQQVQARLVLLIGVPMNQGRALHTFGRAQRRDIAMFHAAHRLYLYCYTGLLSVLELVVHPRHHRHLTRVVKARRHDLPIVDAKQTVVISAQTDPWPEPINDIISTSAHGYSFLSLGNAHSHLWLAPEHYIEIITAYEPRLLA